MAALKMKFSKNYVLNGKKKKKLNFTKIFIYDPYYALEILIKSM